MTSSQPHRLARWRGGHLPPGLPADLVQGLRHEVLHFGDLAIEVPAPDAAQMQAVARHVREAARRVLQPLRVSEVIGLVDRAVHRLLDAGDPWRQRADDLLPRVTGYDAEMVRLGLTAYLHNFRAPQLHRFVAEDFANPKVLDEFQPSPRGGQVRALGPALLAHGWAGNVPGLPLWSLACGLLVEAGNVGKLPSAEPVFASLFAQLLAEVHPLLADALAVVWWRGGEAEPADTLWREAECVLAYGGQAAIEQVRGRVPATTRFLGYGHKLGVALAGREALDPRRVGDLARRVAHDVVRYEQQAATRRMWCTWSVAAASTPGASRSGWPRSWPPPEGASHDRPSRSAKPPRWAPGARPRKCAACRRRGQSFWAMRSRRGRWRMPRARCP